jgi:hypothetical protein
MTHCSEPEMKNVVQEILNNIRRAQKIHEIKSLQGDLWQSRTSYPGECEDTSPSGGTGMNKVIGGR